MGYRVKFTGAENKQIVELRSQGLTFRKINDYLVNRSPQSIGKQYNTLMELKPYLLKKAVKGSKDITVTEYRSPTFNRIALGFDKSIKCPDDYMAKKMMVDTLYEVKFKDVPAYMVVEDNYELSERHTTAYGF